MSEKSVPEIRLNTPAPPLVPRWQTPCFDKLNQLEWPHHFTFDCFGARTAVRATDAGLLEELRDHLPCAAQACADAEVDQVFSAILGGREPGSRVRTFHMLYQNHTQFVRSRKREDVVSGFDKWLPITLAHTIPDGVFVHAGVVAWKGRAILIPGLSHSGKSTLIRELVEAGAEYFSDEYAIIDLAGHVRPYPKPLSIRRPQGGSVDLIPVEEIGGRQATEPVPVGLVVMTHYKEGAKWRPRRLSPSQSVLSLLSNTIAVRSRPNASMRTMGAVSQHAWVVRSTRGEAQEAAEKILRMADRLG